MELQYAIVNGLRIKPKKGLDGICPNCGSKVIAKCGEERVHHWAHQARRNCDPWHENETQWHRDWKNQFPEEWQEIPHRAIDGEKHIADLKRPDGLVVEIQYSHIDQEERRKREEFYNTLIWIVSGVRLKRSIPGMEEALGYGRLIHEKPPIYSVFTYESQLLQKWVTSKKTVFFDFEEHIVGAKRIGNVREPVVWRLDPSSSEDTSYLTPIYKSQLVSDIRNVEIGKNSVSGLISAIQLSSRHGRMSNVPISLMGFERYMYRRRSRPRF